MPFSLNNMEEKNQIVIDITIEVARMMAKFGGSFLGAQILGDFMEVLKKYEGPQKPVTPNE